MSSEKLIRKRPTFIVLVIIGIYAKIINIYHRYPNKIFIMSHIMTISIFGDGQYCLIQNIVGFIVHSHMYQKT